MLADPTLQYPGPADDIIETKEYAFRLGARGCDPLILYITPGINPF